MACIRVLLIDILIVKLCQSSCSVLIHTLSAANSNSIGKWEGKSGAQLDAEIEWSVNA